MWFVETSLGIREKERHIWAEAGQIEQTVSIRSHLYNELRQRTVCEIPESWRDFFFSPLDLHVWKGGAMWFKSAAWKWHGVILCRPSRGLWYSDTQSQNLRLILSLCSHPGVTRSLYSHVAIPGRRYNIRRTEKQEQEVCAYRIQKQAVAKGRAWVGSTI